MASRAGRPLPPTAAQAELCRSPSRPISFFERHRTVVPLDPGSLTSDLRLAIGLLTRSPEIARLLGRLARERVVERYSLARNIDLMIEDYRQLLSESVRLRR